MHTSDKKSFTIANLTLCFESDAEIGLLESFSPFCSEMEPDYRIRFHETEILQECPQEWTYEGISYMVTPDGKGGFRRFFRDVRRDNRLYATAEYDWKNRKIDVAYLPEGREFVRMIDSCFFHIAWESLLMREQRMMLHSTCVETQYGGILFCGPSGIGKSTQADLWCRFRNGRLLNGDRTILHREEEGWIAYGSPYAGSSRCYVNKRCQIRAIVRLKQGKNCRIRKLTAVESFFGVFSCMTVNSWDRSYVSAACDFTEKLVEEVTVYELCCTPDEDAVRVLESKLQRREEK